ncbi:MAG: response regulator, partial [Mariprofundaceae bacterium]|nr:response regulator [Mariprofundaceae bacterium]
MSCHILIIEDQAAVREVVVESIAEILVDIEIGEASSLAEGRVLFHSQHWDMVITDYNLGDGKGLDLIEEIREQGIDIPVILISGFLSPSRVKRAQELAVNRVFAKPFRPFELESAVKELLEKDMSGKQADEAEARVEVSYQSGSSYHTEGRLLPKLFDMDRNQSLLFRIIN